MIKPLVIATFPNPYAQIAVLDSGTTDLPDWDTGDERAVATSQALYISTRSDTSGPVNVQVISGNGEVQPGAEQIFQGTLRIDSGRLEVGSPLAGTVERIALGICVDLTVTVFVRPAVDPSDIWIHLLGVPDGGLG
jgi:hypothetical protein